MAEKDKSALWKYLKKFIIDLLKDPFPFPKELKDLKQPIGEKPDQSKYYRVLGINPGATKNEIHDAYIELAKKWHPDRFVNAGVAEIEEATDKFQEITDAHDHLCS